ncbi:MAG: type II toxin-antitoxin system VapC family toxin [Deltaproteobacteria bacterium]|nr:type II toxin-antitoxin system VapC family toxin [Deltaproteobacteria bacterium]
MVIVDTNVLAYALLDGDRTRDAQALLLADDDWHTDSFALVEFSNLLATSIRVRGLAPAVADGLLAAAEELVSGGMHTVPHAAALTMATRCAVSACDARFLALADELGGRLITEDLRLRNAAPGLTRSLAAALEEMLAQER